MGQMSSKYKNKSKSGVTMPNYLGKERKNIATLSLIHSNIMSIANTSHHSTSPWNYNVYGLIAAARFDYLLTAY